MKTNSILEAMNSKSHCIVCGEEFDANRADKSFCRKGCTIKFNAMANKVGRKALYSIHKEKGPLSQLDVLKAV